MAGRSQVCIRQRIGKKGAFLAEITAKTGVTHQVRVHLASQGYPLIGDSLYDPDYSTRSIQPAWHQLRAIELLGTERNLKVSAEAFIHHWF